MKKSYMKSAWVQMSLIILFAITINIVMFGLIFVAYFEHNQPYLNQDNTTYLNVKVESLYKQAKSMSALLSIESSNSNSASTYIQLMDLAKRMDSKILNAHFTTYEGQNFIDGSHQGNMNIEEMNWFLEATIQPKISNPYSDVFSNKEIVTVSVLIQNNFLENVGVLGLDIDYEQFKNDILKALPSEPNLFSINYSLDYDQKLDKNRTENSKINIHQSQYFITENLNLFNALLTFMSQFKYKILLFLLLQFTIGFYLINKNKRIIDQAITKLMDKYYKGIQSKAHIIEFETMMSNLDVLIHQIDEMSESLDVIKIKENELIFDLRHKIKQFEELDKNNSALQNKDQYLKEFFASIVNNVDQLIWIVDTEGNIIFINNLLKETLNVDSRVNQVNKMSDFIEGFDHNLGILLKKDFKSIKFTFKNQLFNEALNGVTHRVKEYGKVNAILCACTKSNFEEKMNLSYLKKSRDLHFINEIGKIISVNNSIDATLQEVLDKVAFLSNLNSGTIRLINDKDELELKTSSGYSSEYVFNRCVGITSNHIGYAFRENKIILINHKDDLLFPEEILERVLKDGRAIAYIPLANYQKSFGVMSIISDSEFTTDTLVLLESISINVTIALEKVLLYDQLKANYFKTVEAFVTAAEIKQERFSGHSRRVASICKLIAKRLYLSDSEVDEIYIAGLLHDIGKLSFSDNSLEYFFDINEHGHMGRKMIENVGFSKDILEGIEHHHLDYDLTNITNEVLQEQPYYAQIIRLANDFELFVKYKEGEFISKDFITKIEMESGKAYSPQLMKILEDILDNQVEELQGIYL